VEIITQGEVLGLEGGPGRFTANVRQHPRYIDVAKCTSCGECAKVCPVPLPNEYDEGLSHRRAAFKRYAQAIPGAFAIHKADKAPCRVTCPAGLNVQGYVQMVKEGKYQEALEIIMKDLPLPGVLGRICPHGCEDACRRAELDEPIAIRDLKRLAADRFDPREIVVPCAPGRPETVAIVGSGPAGLSCAYHLARAGILSTIYEAQPKPGGMLRVGIPAHRLPRDVLDREIEVITNLGVKIKTDSALGRDISIDGLFAAGFKAVYLALGAHKGIELGIPGERTDGVRQGVDFLREANLSGNTWVGQRVAIIGGGNVAIDVSRSAVRLGAEEVTILYRRTRKEMPAWEEEIRAAEAEGVKITYLAAPQEVLTHEGRVRGLRCIRMELTEPDSSGRRRPVPVPGSEFELACDQIIPAIGQRPDLSALEEVAGLSFSRYGTAEADAVTYATGRAGVFAGGDLLTGPWVAIGAVAAGKEAAESILRYIDGRDLAAGREPVKNEHPRYRPVPRDEPRRHREHMPELPVAQRQGNFKEVELGYDDAAGRGEAARCINCGYCCECLQCVEACLAKAVVHDQKPVEREIQVGSVILCPGSNPFDPAVIENVYPYRKCPNVMTSLEFERLLSASGPTMGHLVRPSDGKEPKKIAWLQCVGSRDINRSGNGYCSSVCCMYAIKDAMIAKEHAHGELDCAIFYMDIRTFGKEYEKYYLRARDKAGVRFIKARIHSVDEADPERSLHLRYVDDAGRLQEEVFDMVVLSVGLQVAPETRELAERLGVEVDKYRFAVSPPFMPVATSRPGVFACGVFQQPKDIPGSVAEASAAACLAGRLLAPARNRLTRQVEIPAEIDVRQEPPRIGVFVCNCGVNIAGVVDVPAVVEHARRLPNVVFAGQNLFTCSQDSQEQMKQVIAEHRLNRVVVAACSPKTHEGIFMDTLEATGRNKYLLEMANIRNQDSWVHAQSPQRATAKAKELVDMAAARAATLNPLQEKVIPVNQRALVIGGGVAGMSAAVAIADQGYEVVLVEKEERLGGMANRLHATIEGWDVQRFLQELIGRVQSHPRIQALTRALVVGFSGFKGNFTTEVLVGPAMYERKIDHGVVILATGAVEYKPTEYSYGQDPRIITQVELSERLHARGAQDLAHVVMIQCVGSRNDHNPNCSRICCQNAVKNAVTIKKLNPEAQVVVLYRDIRTYGLLEDYYQEARKLGVLFFRFEAEDPPRVEAGQSGVTVKFRDAIIGRDLEVDADLLVLSAGMVPSDTEELASLVKLARTPEGHFMEAHVKLRPVDMATEGLFICGTAHSPQLLNESISQAYAAASRAITFLSKSRLTLSAVTAKVTAELCAACLICVRSCPYHVPKINADGVSEIDEALCHGCGICAAECPAKAIQLNWYEDDQLLCKVDALLEGVI
jgi:heterodisulfide reductase subunit A-like polyferredoxin